MRKKIHQAAWYNSVMRSDEWWKSRCGIFSETSIKPTNFKQAWDKVDCARCLKLKRKKTAR